MFSQQVLHLESWRVFHGISAVLNGSPYVSCCRYKAVIAVFATGLIVRRNLSSTLRLVNPNEWSK